MQVQQWAKRLMNNEYASRFALEAVPEVLKKIAQAINEGQLGEPVPRPANLPSHMPGRSATHNLARNNGGRGSAARQHRYQILQCYGSTSIRLPSSMHMQPDAPKEASLRNSRGQVSIGALTPHNCVL